MGVVQLKNIEELKDLVEGLVLHKIDSIERTASLILHFREFSLTVTPFRNLAGQTLLDVLVVKDPGGIK